MILPIIAIQHITVPCEFVFTSQKALTSVSVAGTFNSWDKTADPLTPNAEKTSWKLTKNIPVGDHQYKFVLNETDWVTDPKAPSSTDAGGNTNSLLTALPADFNSPAKTGDNIISTSVIASPQDGTTYHFDQGVARLQITVRPGDVEKITLKTSTKSYPATRIGGDTLTDLYQAQVPWDTKSLVSYTFEIQDGTKTITLTPAGTTEDSPNQPTFTLDPAKFTPFPVPSWPQSTVFYQIFPDRFNNGDTTNDPTDVQPWNAPPTYFNKLGGDLAGVSQKIPYLTKLGVNGIYFNPLFKSRSNHGYETDDYSQIEPRYGSNQEFATLTKDLHKSKLKVMLDGVFNHTGTEFAPFQDLLKSQDDSPYKDWFFVNKFPVKVEKNPNYLAWAGFESLPKLNVTNPAVTQFLLKTVQTWQKQAHIDGWRLDVANEVAPSFWRTFRVTLKNNNPETYILGENWTDSSPWLTGDQWDAAMNYPLRGAILDFIAYKSSTPRQFLDRVQVVYAMHPPQVSKSMLTFLGTHDTPRILHECKQDGESARLAAVALFGLPGSPCIYYGDELGMTGAQDPDNRRAMDWTKNSPDNPFLQTYTKLARARTQSKALTNGEPLPLLADDDKDIVAFARTTSQEAAIIVLNRSHQTESFNLNLPTGLSHLSDKTLTDTLTGKTVHISPSGKLNFSIARRSGAILLPRLNQNNAASTPANKNSKLAPALKPVQKSNQTSTR